MLTLWGSRGIRSLPFPSSSRCGLGKWLREDDEETAPLAVDNSDILTDDQENEGVDKEEDEQEEFEKEVEKEVEKEKRLSES